MTTTPSTGTSGAKQQAQETASTAADEGKHVAGVAAEQARDVAGEAKEHARNLVGEAQGQLGEQTRTQRDRLVGTLQSFSDDLQQMASSSEGSSGLAGEVARQVADRARSLSTHLDGREPTDILDDVRRFARQRPGTFLLGALAAGVVAGRLARGAKDASSGSGSSGGYLDTSTTRTSSGPGLVETDAPGTATGSPLAGVTGDVSGDDPTRSPGLAGPGAAGGTGTGIDDPLSAADPALGAHVPPSSTGRYEP